ncbi:hypothetical protein [Desulfosporosinus sp. FKB]|nr:hypothetical protein [Desulfosporosinus sp. FKB]
MHLRKFNIESQKGIGTTVFIKIPVNMNQVQGKILDEQKYLRIA